MGMPLTQIGKLTIAVVEFIVQDYLGTDLSLVGNYYSYEAGEGGIIGCGVPGNSLSVRTVDVCSGKEVSLTQIFTEKSILKAMKSDQ